MIDHKAIQLACRVKALTLSVATTGATSLSATATGYARAAGSFITDGFTVGMEVAGTSFSNSENNDAKAITAVTALALTCPGCTVEAAGTRTLTVGLPEKRQWENVPLTSVTGRPYVTEQYIPGTLSRETLGPLGQLEATPMYALHIHAPENTGISGAAEYADALITLFAPGTAITVGSDTLRVRGDIGPFRGQLMQSSPGWAVIPVTIPFRLRTANSI